MSESAQKDSQVRRIILIEGAANLLVLIIKTIIGFSTGSMAILADAVHSLSDMTNNIVAWIVMHFSSQPADREHPYGHRKFESIAVFILASILVVLAFEVALNAIRKEASEVASSGIELGVMLGVLVVNITVTRWEQQWARRLDSDILRADATHTFADVLITITVIIGWQLSAMGYIWVDRICALAVALVVVYLAFNLFKRTLPVLVDEYAIEPDELKRLILSVDGVLNVYKIRSRWIGKACTVELVISVDPALSVEESHRIADEVEDVIEQNFDAAHISIHVEPHIET